MLTRSGAALAVDSVMVLSVWGGIGRRNLTREYRQVPPPRKTPGRRFHGPWLPGVPLHVHAQAAVLHHAMPAAASRSAACVVPDAGLQPHRARPPRARAERAPGRRAPGSRRCGERRRARRRAAGSASTPVSVGRPSAVATVGLMPITSRPCASSIAGMVCAGSSGRSSPLMPTTATVRMARTITARSSSRSTIRERARDRRVPGRKSAEASSANSAGRRVTNAERGSTSSTPAASASRRRFVSTWE